VSRKAQTRHNAGFLIGIDIGTSGAKAVVIDLDGRLLAWAGREYPIHTPRPGWAEQDPREWVAAALACMGEAVRRSGIDPRRAAAIGLAGQMHSLVCLDARGEPLRPAILWADQRSAGQVRQLVERIGLDNLAAWTGNPLAAGFMLASWAWLVENEPAAAGAARWLASPKDYVRYRLTGTLGTEPGDASATLLFDPHSLSWSRPLLDSVGLEVERLPQVFPSSSVAGGLLAEPARACGLPEGIPVVYGSSDVSLQALAQGVVEPGEVSCTIGTGGQLFAPLQAPRHDPRLRLHLFCHAIPGTWHHEAAILSAGLALRWLRDQVFPGTDYAGLADSAAAVESGLDGLFFLPFLVGERTPYMEPGLQAGFLGLGLRHGRAHLVRAVLEGVIFELRQGLDLLMSLGTPVERLLATGGATRHSLWLQLQADIFNRPVYVSNVEEATARGAALLAGIGAGIYQGAREAIQRAVTEPAVGAAPDAERAARYAAAYAVYRGWANLVVDRYRAGW
jgi:xylulokinase